jgi:hypothetical protein
MDDEYGPEMPILVRPYPFCAKYAPGDMNFARGLTAIK